MSICFDPFQHTKGISQGPWRKSFYSTPANVYSFDPFCPSICSLHSKDHESQYKSENINQFIQSNHLKQITQANTIHHDKRIAKSKRDFHWWLDCSSHHSQREKRAEDIQDTTFSRCFFKKLFLIRHVSWYDNFRTLFRKLQIEGTFNKMGAIIQLNALCLDTSISSLVYYRLSAHLCSRVVI